MYSLIQIVLQILYTDTGECKNINIFYRKTYFVQRKYMLNKLRIKYKIRNQMYYIYINISIDIDFQVFYVRKKQQII